MSYDKSKKTTGEDVKKELGEAASAAVDYVHDNAATLLAEAGQKAKDAFVAVEKKFYALTRKCGFSLHDPTQDVVVTHLPTEVAETDWVKEQAAKGLIKEVEAPAQEVPAPKE